MSALDGMAEIVFTHQPSYEHADVGCTCEARLEPRCTVEGYAEHVADALAKAGYGKLADAETQAYAKVIARIELGTPYMVNEKYVAGANWVRSQIEDVLAPAIEDALGAEK